MELWLLSLALFWSYGLRTKILTITLEVGDLRPWDSFGIFDFGLLLNTWIGSPGFIRYMTYSLLI